MVALTVLLAVFALALGGYCAWVDRRGGGSVHTAVLLAWMGAAGAVGAPYATGEVELGDIAAPLWFSLLGALVAGVVWRQRERQNSSEPTT